MNFLEKMKNRKFVKLKLSDIRYEYDRVLQNPITVILGSPGSGKTTLMKYMQREFDGVFYSVKDFMDLYNEEEISQKLKERQKDVLLLDGFDEYRIFNSDKIFIMRKFAKKIDDIRKWVPNLKVIITCRELDWYGDTDEGSLSEILQIEPVVYRIEPLDDEVLEAFLDNFKGEIRNLNEFKHKFYVKGFLSTPQLFMISKELQHAEVENKIDLYRKFILNAIEEMNKYHKEIEVKKSNEEILEHLGYMAYFYMFSNIDKFDVEVLKEIASSLYSIDVLEKLLKTKLFEDGQFIHRTFAEFLCAYFFNELLKKEKLPRALIKSRFINGNYVYADLRGTFAWLCSISNDMYFIELDPFYQLIYGENNHFSVDYKKRVLKAIKRYSIKVNPYFVNTKSYSLGYKLRHFYSPELDGFIKQELEEAKKLKNHYILVYEMLLVANKEYISQNLKEYIFDKLKEDYFSDDFKIKMIRYILDVEHLLEIFDLVKEDAIKDDDNRIKISLLERLFPQHISIEEMVSVLKKCEPTNLIDLCYFLYRCPENKVKTMVLLLEREVMPGKRDSLAFPYYCIKDFLSGFYYKLLNSYNGKNEKEIYEFLREVRNYYAEYERIEVKHDFYSAESVKELNYTKKKELSNKMFRLYFEELFKNEKVMGDIILKIVRFWHFYPVPPPTNISQLIIGKLEDGVTDEMLKRDLFYAAMKFWKTSENLEETFNPLAKKFGFENLFENFKESMKAESSKNGIMAHERRVTEKIKNIINRNEMVFKNISKEDFLSDFNLIFYVTRLIYFKRDIKEYFTEETFEKIKGYLKDFVYENMYDQEISLKQLVNNLDKVRNIDIVLFTSLTLNEDYNSIIEKVNEEKIKYLYIITIDANRVSNAIRNERFVKFLENEHGELVKGALLDVLRYVDSEIFDVAKEKLMESNVEKLKNIIYPLFAKNDKENLVNSILKSYKFELSIEELRQLDQVNSTDLLKLMLKFLEGKEILNEEELSKFYLQFLEELTSGDISYAKEAFDLMSDNEKLFLSYNFMKVFSDEKRLPLKSGFLSALDRTREFVRFNLLEMLDHNLLERLLEKDISDYWKRRIRSAIAEKKEGEEPERFQIKQLKAFIENNGILSEKDFFELVLLDLNDLKKRIEENENNEKKMFWKDEYQRKHKKEEVCRDALVNLWTSSPYGKNREVNIADNRTDIEVFHKLKNWKVRIECKVDKNQDLFKAVKKQLIEKYLENRAANYGIYLVFYFGESKESIKDLESKIKKNIPSSWLDKVEVRFIDLRL